MNITNVKGKLFAVADKFINSKVYKGVERCAVTASAALTSAGVMSVSAFAAESDNTALNSITVNTADILNKAQPFITPAITILCCVGGMKLGMRFLRSSMH